MFFYFDILLNEEYKLFNIGRDKLNFRGGREMRSIYIHITGIICMILCSYMMITNEHISTYIASMKSNIVPVSNSDLYHEIQERAPQYNIPAEDAKIDKVWKAIPGYNGREIDIEASYKKMKKERKFDEKKLVFKQVTPKISLKDLEPAPIFRGNSQKKMIALTVNVAWGNEYLPSMIKTLKKTHAEATFFLEGRWTKNNPSLARMIVEEGYEVGNHSYSHPDMSKLSQLENQEELEKTNSVIEAVTKQKVKWFAPPSGSWNDSVVKLAKEMDMETILWTADTIDWQKPSPSTIVQRVVRKAENGAIVLMHPTESTAEALETIIEELQATGYEVVDISTLLDEIRR